MAFTFILPSCLLLVSLLLSSSATTTYTSISVPRISLKQLQSALLPNGNNNNVHLHRLLHESNGILRIAVDTNTNNNNDNKSFSSHRKRALSNLCNCPTLNSSPFGTSDNNIDTEYTDITSFEKAAQLHPRDLQQIILPDGSVRRTLASATIGFDTSSNDGGTLELPSFIKQTCGINTYNSFEELRDVVSNVVDMFVQKLDNEKMSGIDKEEMSQSYRDILSDANHLEHFHVYTKQSEGGDDSNGNDSRDAVVEEDVLQTNTRGGRNLLTEKRTTTLDYHTDAGFFLSFVPAMNCRSYTTDTSSFFLEGQDKPVRFEEDEIVIMMGAGAQHWLPKSQEEQGSVDDQYSFLAASHALRLLPDTHRSWYGKMHLLPTSMTSSSTALSSFQLQDYDAHAPSSPVDGCGTTAGIYDESSVVSKQSRRRLQHVNSPANCNNVTNFFCWYHCINIPDSEQAEDYVYDGYSLYCLDPALLSSSDNPIPDAVDKCKGGYVHNSNCQGSWQETDKTVPGYKLPYEVKKKEQLDKETGNSTSATISYPNPINGDKYCYGGTSMYMDGFTWQGTACVIYLFQSWVLTTPGKFTAAAIGSIFFGIALECVLWKRRSVYAMSPGTRRLCLSALIYGLQLTMGYFIMLVIMTYSGPLFICTVSGMMIGHVIFNAQDSFVKKQMEKRESRRLSALDAGSTTYGSTRHMGEQESDSTCNELGSYQNGGNLKSPPEKNGVNETTKLTSNKKLRSATADGATPCCQYSLDD